MVAIGAAIKIGQIIIRFAKGAGRFTSGETTILSRFPPNYRPGIKQIIKGANIVTAGGLIADVLQSEWNEYGSIPQVPKKPFSYKQSKEYRSVGKYSSRGRNGYVQRRCKPRYNASNRYNKRSYY